MQSLWRELITQVFCPLCYCPVVVIGIHFKRLFPLLTGAKSLLSQWLTNSYLHLLNLPPPNLQLTDPSSDWWQGGVGHTCMLCLCFIQALKCLFLPMLPKPEPADTLSLTQKHSSLNRLAEENQDRKQKIGSTCPADKLQLISMHLDKQRNTIFGLLFFGYRMVQHSWSKTPDSKKLTRQCCSVPQKEVAAKSGTMMQPVQEDRVMVKQCVCVCVSLKFCGFCAQGGAWTGMGDSRSCCNRTGRVTWHSYPQKLVLLTHLSLFFVFSVDTILPLLLHSKGVQSSGPFLISRHYDTFLLCPVGWIAAQAEGNMQEGTVWQGWW